MNKPPRSLNSFPKPPQGPPEMPRVEQEAFRHPVEKPEGVLGGLHIPHEAANSQEFIESAEKRKNVYSIEDKAAAEWLHNIHSYTDYRSLLRMYRQGFVTFENGAPKLNVSAFKGKIVKEFMPMPFLSGMQDLHECLLRNGVADVPDLEAFKSINAVERRSGVQKGTIKYPIHIPDSLQALLHGEPGKSTYGGKAVERWYDPVTLADGTSTNALEVHVAQSIAEAKVIRKNNGFYFTEGEYAGKPASMSKILGRRDVKYSQHGFHFPEGKSTIEVFSFYLPNLRKMGLLQESDFEIKEQGKEISYMKFVPKSKTDVSLRSGIATSKYYFGRDKYIHSNKEIPPGTATMVLDATTAGIFEKENGVVVLKYTFPLITQEELDKEKEKTAAKFGVTVEQLTPSQVTQNTRKSLRPEEIREYSASSYISPYAEESKREYGQRLGSFYNAEATVNAVNEIFIKADLNQLPISWGKKMRLAEAVKTIPKEKIISFAKQYGLPGLQVLLASEADKGWPEEVLSFADRPENAALFAAYAPLLTDEDEFRTLIDASTIRNNEAREYLADLRRVSLEDVIAGIRKVVRGEAPLADVVAKSREGVLGKLSLVKALKKEGLLDSLEDIKGIQFGIQSPQDIPERDRQAMRALYAQNYAGNPNVQKELLKKFDASIADTSGKNRFFVFRHNGAVKGFYRLEETAPGQYYFASFNIDPAYKGYKLGETMLEQSLDLEAKDSVITADCDSKLPISAKYIETGWVATRYWDDHGDKVLDIVRNDKERERYHGKQLSAKNIISGNVPEGMLVKIAGEQKDLPFELCNEGYALTRMFFDQKSRQHYAVFESALPARTTLETSADASHK